MKRAIIIGCQGQDGRLLYEYLIKKGYQVIGIDINHVRASHDCSTQLVNIADKDSVYTLISSSQPNEIYYLAAVHHSSEDTVHDKDKELFQKSFEVNTLSLIYFLEAMLKYSPSTRLFYAASSHIFGDNDCSVNDENSPINPTSAYGISKAAGLFVCRHYRTEHLIFSSCGILYNHESSYRNDNFISKKIIQGAVRIKRKQQDKIVLGDINAEVDWGYAPDYIDAMHRILNIEYPDDFVIATGKKHRVSEFAEIAFAYLGLEWNRYVEENRNILSRKPVCRVGNPSKLMSMTGWKPSVDFKEMIKLFLVEEGAFEED